jgi:adenosylcobinamide-GDP ribazoletransferase
LVIAPVVGLLLGLGSALPLVAGRTDLAGALLTATLTVALGAWLTRGLHWDGLADLTDGLGSRRPPDGALAVMRASDIGTFATLVLLFAVLLQVFSVALLPAGGPAVAGWVSAQVGARIALGLAAGSWFRPARGDGLGAAVIGSVTHARAVALVTLGAAVAVTACWVGGLAPALGLVSVVAAAAVAVLVGRVAAGRLGGSTGDVLGATVESTATVILVLLALAA